MKDRQRRRRRTKKADDKPVESRRMIGKGGVYLGEGKVIRCQAAPPFDPAAFNEACKRMEAACDGLERMRQEDERERTP